MCYLPGSWVWRPTAPLPLCLRSLFLVICSHSLQDIPRSAGGARSQRASPDLRPAVECGFFYYSLALGAVSIKSHFPCDLCDPLRAAYCCFRGRGSFQLKASEPAEHKWAPSRPHALNTFVQQRLWAHVRDLRVEGSDHGNPQGTSGGKFCLINSRMKHRPEL